MRHYIKGNYLFSAGMVTQKHFFPRRIFSGYHFLFTAVQFSVQINRGYVRKKKNLVSFTEASLNKKQCVLCKPACSSSSVGY